MIGKRSRRVLCLALALLIASCAALTGVSAQETSSRKVLLNGTFIMWSLKGEAIQDEYFYSDSYFDRSGKEQNAHLRTLSAAVSVSLCQTVQENGINSSILRRIGFSDFVMEDMNGATSDSIGTVIAKKRIGDTDVIALMLRGYNYGGEWASNFTCSDAGDSVGFADSAKKAEERLLSYLNERQIRSAKIWITGYSRSAAVANFVGKALNENPQTYATASDDIYVYAFEPPNFSADDIAYENIHNIIDCRDIVTYLYPAGWGLSRCGVTEPIGDADEMIMSKKFVLLSENLMKDYQEVNLRDFLSETADLMSQYVSRETYASQVEEHLVLLSDMYFGFSDRQKEALMTFLNQFLENFKNDENIATVLLNMLASRAGDKEFQAFVDLIIYNLDKTVDETENPMSDEQFEELKAAIQSIVFALKPMIKADAATKITDAQGVSTKVTLYHLMTILGNLETLIPYHIYFSVFDQLKAADSYYTEELQRIGDSDGDGSVTVLDATAIQKSLAKLYTIGESRETVSDVDDDRVITVLDATCIQKYLAALGNPYQIDAFLLE
ncbi:MAG: hypothetical protein IJH32_04805 [Ruminococcus sp.]|nr:hypothetical protein [Ruminococcus sp.]